MKTGSFKVDAFDNVGEPDFIPFLLAKQTLYSYFGLGLRGYNESIAIQPQNLSDAGSIKLIQAPSFFQNGLSWKILHKRIQCLQQLLLPGGMLAMLLTKGLYKQMSNSKPADNASNIFLVDAWKTAR